MAGSHSIRDTLLRKLFIRPNPLEADLFRAAKPFVLPAEDDLRRFLEERNPQEQLAIAQTIVLRLVKLHHFPPPTRLLFNLLDFEERHLPLGKGSYTPQDHFLHLVYLYLLGLYLFSYHRGIHDHCVRRLLYLQRTFKHRARKERPDFVASFNPYATFATAWASFVLYHDLAYPLESVPPQNRSVLAASLKPFGRVRKSIIKDLSLKALSELLVLDFIVRAEPRQTLGELYGGTLEAFAGTSSDGPVASRWFNASLLAGIEPGFTLESLTAFFPPSQLCAVLENTTSGEPVLFVTGGAEPPVILHPSTGASLRRLRSLTPEVIHDFAFDTGVAPVPSTSWRYFGLTVSDTFTSVVNNLFGTNIADFRTLSREMGKSASFRLFDFASSASGNDLAHHCYERLNRDLTYTYEPEDTWSSEERFNEVESAALTTVRALPRLAGRAVEGVLAEWIEKLDEANLKGVVKERLARDVAEEIVSAKDKIVRRLAGLISENLLGQIRARQQTKEVQRRIFAQLQGVVPALKGGLENSPISAATSLKKAVESAAESLGTLDRLIGAAKLGDVATLVREVTPDHVLQKDSPYNSATYFDHGFAGALIVCQARQLYAGIAHSLVQNPGDSVPLPVLLLRLALRCGSRNDDHLLGFEATELFDDVAYAVALHNFAPAWHRGNRKDYRTRLRRDPFTFLALLADGLQRWDRPKLINQVQTALPFSLWSDGFDLEVVEERLIVRVHGTRLKVEDEQAKWRQVFAEYLDLPHEFFRLELIEE